ncbi:FAD-binding oxidoreductase [Aneurinibacillus aneurinilyticus]|nr:FAD-binding oxidoreductase [Aneurinibacillus aneurinilyticus]MCI1692719.1 FAD-binding oxidoreductase [Aneurinibacillus aneurinilyticus]MED0668775.1 FAD-binding oxidoreductase [Aneurinibacillus aneurinilyticus]MED0707229.1 FAD-binding oxidoreductase [Aneurinibacillus aneurinilyticus]MED0722034.1 FAD-binding oxidoreductase [Aneurinibacillus aneurinilyticus]MED0732543.1 FAD-binding oxidoreductase [Aneurinibacillus aneurinilyticus]
MIDKGTLLQQITVEAAPASHPLGNTAPCIFFPEGEQEIVEILKYARQNRMRLIPMGGGTKRGFGGVEEMADAILSLSRCSGIIEHSPGDMIVTVRPGTTVQELQNCLAEYGQMLPLDPAWPAYATVGGIVAAGDSGPKRLRYGSARDHVIAMRVVYPDGTIIRTGAKVVKNVAGYDMNKLFIGSMGTLGIISELSFKLRPLPKAERLLLLSFSEGEMDAIRGFIRSLQDSRLEPVSLELISPTLAGRLGEKPEYMLAIAFEDVESAVRYQEAWVRSCAPEASLGRTLIGREAQMWWDAFACIPPYGLEENGVETRIAMKIGSKNTDVPDIIAVCHHLGQDRGVTVEAHGGAGHGISYIFFTGGTEEELASCADATRRLAQDRGGYAIVRHAPLSLRRRIGAWGEVPAHFPLLEGIKHTIDPDRILNPGRFIGGI